MTTLQTAVFDTKSYDRESLQRAGFNGDVEWRFLDWRLSAETAASAEGARAVCIFVNVANLVAFATGQPFLPGTSLNAQPQSQ